MNNSSIVSKRTKININLLYCQLDRTNHDIKLQVLQSSKITLNNNKGFLGWNEVEK